MGWELLSHWSKKASCRKLPSTSIPHYINIRVYHLELESGNAYCICSQSILTTYRHRFTHGDLSTQHVHASDKHAHFPAELLEDTVLMGFVETQLWSRMTGESKERESGESGGDIFFYQQIFDWFNLLH